MQYIIPTWPAPKNIYAYTTTRKDGQSPSPYLSFNLAHHVGDNPNSVLQNRRILINKLQLPSEPIWLSQCHGNTVLMGESRLNNNPEADATYTRQPNTVCVVLTADCLPILICNLKGTLVSAVHAGWKGLANDIVPLTLNRLGEDPKELLAWLGPAIGPEAFEVSEDVREIFVNKDRNFISAFKPKTNNKWLANLYQLATIQLNNLGVNAVYGGEYCTYNNSENFYSHRREGTTGRMASLIWLSS